MDNKIVLVKSGEPRSELQKARDALAIFQAKLENLGAESQVDIEQPEYKPVKRTTHIKMKRSRV